MLKWTNYLHFYGIECISCSHWVSAEKSSVLAVTESSDWSLRAVLGLLGPSLMCALLPDIKKQTQKYVKVQIHNMSLSVSRIRLKMPPNLQNPVKGYIWVSIWMNVEVQESSSRLWVLAHAWLENNGYRRRNVHLLALLILLHSLQSLLFSTLLFLPSTRCFPDCLPSIVSLTRFQSSCSPVSAVFRVQLNMTSVLEKCPKNTA